MKEFTESVLNKYGLKAVVVVILAVVVVWFLAHFTAERGTKVSVFWGLVQYTKSISSPVDQVPQSGSVREKWSPSDSDTSTHEIIAVRSKERIYLNKRPRELLQSVANLTGLQGSVFEEKHYAGKWMRIKGPVDRILGSSNRATLVFKIDGLTTRVDMKEEFFDRVSHLQDGDVVTVDGMFKLMDHIGPDFENGELVAIE